MNGLFITGPPYGLYPGALTTIQTTPNQFIAGVTILYFLWTIRDYRCCIGTIFIGNVTDYFIFFNVQEQKLERLP